MNTPKDSPWLSASQAAALKRVSRQAVTKAIRTGRLAAEAWNNSYRLRREVVEAWEPERRGPKPRGTSEPPPAS